MVWPPNMPDAAPAKLPATNRSGAAAVYLPACINRIFGRSKAEKRLIDSERALASLDALAATGAGAVLTGHGPPLLDGVEVTVERARHAGIA